MESTEKPVLLRAQGEDKSQEFSPAHAERLLKLPGTLWSKVADESKAPKASAAPTEK